MTRKLIYLLAGICFSTAFIACNKDDDHNEPTPPPVPDKIYPLALTEGRYNTQVIAGTSTGKDTTDNNIITFTPTGSQYLKLSIPQFSSTLGVITIDSITVIDRDGYPFFEVKDKPITLKKKIYQLNMKGSVAKENIIIQMILTGADADNSYTVDFRGLKMKNDLAVIYSMVFDSDLIAEQPLIVNKDIYFYVKADADITKLQFKPIIQLAAGALINPELGQVIDFTDAITTGDAVKINVVSQDFSAQSTYNVYCRKIADINNSFEKWVKGVEGQEESKTYYEVANGWASSNGGAQMIKLFLPDVEYPVSPLEAPKTGKYAAKITTIHSDCGTSGTMFGIPHVTSGSLFLGKFLINTTNTLLSTKFGVPYAKKPIRFKGYYKYTPGKDYYVASNPKGTATTIDNTKTDACAINAVLYEVSNYAEADANSKKYIKESLTGVDLLTSGKIVARAELKDREAKADYTLFDLEFEYKYGKTYDPAKKYMLAIVFSSSIDGDKFCGAPGSTLIVDDIEVVTE